MKILLLTLIPALLLAQDAKPRPLPERQAVELLKARLTNAQLAVENANLKLRAEQAAIPQEFTEIKARVCAAESIPAAECKVDENTYTVSRVKATPAPSNPAPATSAAQKPAGKDN